MFTSPFSPPGSYPSAYHMFIAAAIPGLARETSDLGMGNDHKLTLGSSNQLPILVMELCPGVYKTAAAELSSLGITVETRIDEGRTPKAHL
jgi:hypothetical protein